MHYFICHESVLRTLVKMTFVYDYTSHMYSVEIRYSALYWWSVRSVKRQFSQWTLGSSTTHSSTGAVKYSCWKTTLQHNAAAGETTPSLHKPLFNSSLSPCPFLPRFLYHVIFLSPYITAPFLVSTSLPVFLPVLFLFFCLLHSFFWHVYLYDLNMYTST